MGFEGTTEAEAAPIEVIEDDRDRDANAGWKLDVFFGSVLLIVIGLLTTLQRRFARWRTRNESDGILLRAVLDEERAVNAAQSYLGPNAVALGLIGLIAVIVGRLTSC